MIQVAVMGFGVVGSGVVELLTGKGEGLRRPSDALLNLKYILDVREFPESPFADLFVKDFAKIEADPDVEIVVETIGGCTIALEFTERALRAGKSVVTSNKEIVAQHGARLMRLAQEHGATYLFEASVGGGIPVLRPLNLCMAANEISDICGILNGTSNYIFTRMIDGGLSFADALAEAQAKGYAERNPSNDVDGHDTCRKICILASIAFGFHVLPEQVETEGMTHISLEDVAAAQAASCKIKLLGRAMQAEDGSVCAYVAPHAVPLTDPLAGVEDVFNAVKVYGNATGDVMFYGKGAGKLPTASAVVADVIAIGRQMQRSAYLPWAEPQTDQNMTPKTLASRFLVRFKGDAVALPAGDLVQVVDGVSTWVSPKLCRVDLDSALAGQEVLSVLRILD